MVISDWQHTMYVFSLFSILLLVLWTMLAKDFSPNDENTHHQEEYKYKDALTDKFVYCFSMGFKWFFIFICNVFSIYTSKISCTGQ